MIVKALWRSRDVSWYSRKDGKVKQKKEDQIRSVGQCKSRQLKETRRVHKGRVKRW